MTQKTREELDASFNRRRVKPDVFQAFTDLLDSVPTLDEVGEGGISNLIEDVTPQLGGNLDANGFSIAGASEQEIGWLGGLSGNIQSQLDNKVIPQDNWSASNAPTATDDETELYSTGSMWNYFGVIYVCRSATEDNAVWTKINTDVNNFFNTSATPGNTDDATQGYHTGSLWLTLSGGQYLYVCVDSTPDNAVWMALTLV